MSPTSHILTGNTAHALQPTLPRMSPRTTLEVSPTKGTAMKRLPRFTVTFTIVAIALTGCSTGDSTPTEPTATETATSAVPEDTEEPPTAQEPDETENDTPTASPESEDTEAPFPASTAADTSEPSGDGALTVTDVRIGLHDGYDRVVLDLGGTGTPGWRAEYVESAIQDGSGMELDLNGDAVLEIDVTGTAYPMDSGQEEYPGPDRIQTNGTVSIEEVRYDHIFEGITKVFVGVDEKRPFRVFALSDPTRVVIDVQGE